MGINKITESVDKHGKHVLGKYLSDFEKDNIQSLNFEIDELVKMLKQKLKNLAILEDLNLNE